MTAKICFVNHFAQQMATRIMLCLRFQTYSVVALTVGMSSLKSTNGCEHAFIVEIINVSGRL